MNDEIANSSSVYDPSSSTFVFFSPPFVLLYFVFLSPENTRARSIFLIFRIYLYRYRNNNNNNTTIPRVPPSVRVYACTIIIHSGTGLVSCSAFFGRSIVRVGFLAYFFLLVYLFYLFNSFKTIL